MKSNTDTDLASKIRQLRIDNNLTQEQVAKALDATPGYICNVENGRTAMSLRMLVFFAKLTHTTLVSQFSDDEKRKLIDTIKLWRA